MLLFINQLQKTTKISDKAIATKYQILQFNDSSDLQNSFPEETFIYSEKINNFTIQITPLIFTCSRSRIETLQKDVKYI